MSKVYAHKPKVGRRGKHCFKGNLTRPKPILTGYYLEIAYLNTIANPR